MVNKLGDDILSRMKTLFDSGMSKVMIARELKVSYSSVRRYLPSTPTSNHAYHSTQYRTKLAHRNGYSSLRDQLNAQIAQRGLTRSEVEEQNAVNAGYRNRAARIRSDQERRAKQPRNRIFSSYISELLPDDLSQAALARCCNIHEATLSLHFRGYSLPSQNNARRILSELGSPYKTIDEVVANYSPSSLAD